MHGTLRLLAKASSSQSLAFCLLVILTAFDVFAQSASTGALTGTVTDRTGAVVPKATITLRNNGTGQVLTAATDLQGLYRFSLLPPGQYELRVEMTGFAPLTLREVMIQISEVRRIPIKLAVQGVREEVEVKSPLLQTWRFGFCTPHRADVEFRVQRLSSTSEELATWVKRKKHGTSSPRSSACRTRV